VQRFSIFSFTLLSLFFPPPLFAWLAVPHSVSYPLIEAFYDSVQKAQLNSLTYFDIGNWGVSINTHPTYPNTTCGLRPSGQAAPCPTPEGSNAYLQNYLTPALLRHGWSLAGGIFNGPFSDWVGTTLMDPGEPTFQELLVEQLAMRMTLVSSAQGIAIDRFDYTQFYNFDADDGQCWVPQTNANPPDAGGPARSLLLSHKAAYAALAAVLAASGPTPSGAGRAMLGNCNTLCRIDLLGSFDGTFSEGAALNAVAWTGIAGRPTTLWTYGLNGMASADLDAFFQQHLLMRTFPMAPIAGNDHSIQPGNATIEGFYADYAPLFFALRGVVWALDIAAPLTIFNTTNASEETLTGNLFYPTHSQTTNGPLPPNGARLVVLSLGGPSTAQQACSFSLAFPSDAPPALAVAALLPGMPQWMDLGNVTVPSGGGTVALTNVPLSRGGAIVRFVPTIAGNGW
jgi:hypothetical protein